ncbi:MAG: ATP synthase subunit I [Gammaproteobacteria bacterium]
MNEGLTLALALMAGLLLGVMFFGGLWWTVRKGLSSKRPALLFLGSMLLRTGVVVAGLYVVSDGHWQRLPACLLGFVIARFIVTRIAGAPLRHYGAPAKEPGHAP